MSNEDSDAQKDLYEDFFPAPPPRITPRKSKDANAGAPDAESAAAAGGSKSAAGGAASGAKPATAALPVPVVVQPRPVARIDRGPPRIPVVSGVPWLAILIVPVLAIAGVGYFVWQRNANRMSQTQPTAVARQTPPPTSLSAPDDFGPLPEIVINPERDDPRVAVGDDGLNQEHRGAYLEEVEMPPEPPAPPVAPEKARKPAAPPKPRNVVSKWPRPYDVTTTAIDIAPGGDDGPAEKGDMIRKVISVGKIVRSGAAHSRKEPVVPVERIADVLVFYSPSFGRSRGGPRGVLGIALKAIDHANARYISKGVGGKLRLVGIVEVNYEGKSNPEDLAALRRGQMRSGCDSTGDLRARVGADFVCFFGSPSRHADSGLAYVPGVYSVVKIGGGPVFTHELQHNFGWNHPMRDDLSILKKNFDGCAARMPRLLPEGELYVQYWLNRNKTNVKFKDRL